MDNPINAILRRPFYGVVPPGSMLAIPVAPPMTAQETLLCVASQPKLVQFTVPRPDAIVVTSTSGLPIAFGVVVIPTNVIGPTDSFWNQITAKVQAWLARLKA